MAVQSATIEKTDPPQQQQQVLGVVKGKFPMILEQEVDAYNSRKMVERKTLFEQNSHIVVQEEEQKISRKEMAYQDIQGIAQQQQPYEVSQVPEEERPRLDAFA